MTWTWETHDDGSVWVDKGDGLGPIAIDLGGADQATLRTEQWAPLAEKYAEQTGVPLSWILAVIYSESGGNPSIASSDSVGGGLMQLTLSIYHLTREQAIDPETNIRLGTATLAQLKTKAGPLGLPAVASMFNAGASSTGPHTSVSDPWGYAETRPSLPYTGYIEKVVRASNYFLARFPPGSVQPAGGTGSSSTLSTGMKFTALAIGAALAFWGATRIWGIP